MAETTNNDTIAMENSETESGGEQSPGKMLQKARINANLTETQIANQLYLSRSVIIAIESDAYHKLPGATFVRGYLRSYARLLNISPEQVMSAYEALGLEAKEHIPATAPVTNTKKQVAANDWSMRWITYIIITGLIVLVVIWWRSHSEKIDEVVVATVTETPESSGQAQAPSTEIHEQQASIRDQDASGSVATSEKVANHAQPNLSNDSNVMQNENVIVETN